MKWEYRFDIVNKLLDMQVLLDGYGEDGWELVGFTAAHVAGGSHLWELVFKRPKSDGLS